MKDVLVNVVLLNEENKKIITQKWLSELNKNGVNEAFKLKENYKSKVISKIGRAHV